MACLALVLAVLAFHLAGCGAQSLDPILNYCYRWQHASVVKWDMLYLDGGYETFRYDGENMTNGKPANYEGQNQYVIKVPLTESWNWRSNISQTAIPKGENPRTGFTPYNGTVRAAMFSGPEDQDQLYTFGGTSPLTNTSFVNFYRQQSVANPLWSMEVDDNSWTPYSSTLDTQPNYGAAAEAPDQALAFYLNGQIDGGTSLATKAMGNYTDIIPGMVVLNFDTQTARNISTSGLDSKTYPRTGGMLQYVPGVGRDGLLVSLGGAYSNSSDATEWAGKILATFDTVDVFDIASFNNNQTSNGVWYSQRTTGDIPSPRIDSCVVMFSAPDNSSHNIYLYSGRDPTSTNENGTVVYDDLYALSLPSFTWTRLLGGESPRWGHTCHAVGHRQMITLGGMIPTQPCDWEYRGIAVIDLSMLVWGQTYVYNDAAYTVSSPIVSNIGGTINGNATVTSPKNGWDSAGLETVFRTARVWPAPRKRPSSSSSSTGTPSSDSGSSSSHPSAGVIAGATVGSVLGAALIAAAAFFFVRQRGRHEKDDASIEAAKDVEPDPALEAPNNERVEIEGDTSIPTEVDSKMLPYELETPVETPTEMAADHGYSEAHPRSPIERVEPAELYGSESFTPVVTSSIPEPRDERLTMGDGKTQAWPPTYEATQKEDHKGFGEKGQGH